MLREMKSPQRLSRVLPFRIDGAAVAGGTLTQDGILEGKFHALITENSAGDYTITFNQPFARVPVVMVSSLTDVTTCWVKSASATAVEIEQVGADQTTPVADGSFHLLIVGYDSADQT